MRVPDQGVEAPAAGSDHPDPATAGATVRVGTLADLVPVLVGRLPGLLTEVGQLLAEDWPDYAQFLAQEHIEVSVAAESFLHGLISTAERDLARTPRGPVPEPGVQTALFEEIGRIQWREGRELSTLLSAYQVGARVAWHHVSSTALELGVPPKALAALAEAVFVFIDQLSSASARGYVMEQSEAAVTRERLRDELAELLLSDRSDSSAVRAAAARAGWPLPREVSVILLAPDNPLAQNALGRLDSSCLLIRQPDLLGAIVPDPRRPGRRRRLAATLAGAGAVVGLPVPPEYLPASVGIAEIAADLQRGQVLREDPVFADEHLDAIIVHRDARLLDALRRQVLAPLAGLGPTVQQRLRETLTAWVRCHGDRQAMAAALHIHPQTVRYRMTQLHDLFGSALDDPANRMRLTLALAWGDGAVPEPAPATTTRRRPTATRPPGAGPSPSLGGTAPAGTSSVGSPDRQRTTLPAGP